MISKKIILRAARLQMFSEGAATTGAATGTDGAAVQTQVETTSGSDHRTSGRKKGDLSNVVYGKQDAPENSGTGSAAESKADVTTTSNTLENRRQAFEELIGGEYKEEFTQRTQEIINRRFKETKNLEARLNEQKPILDMLMSRYKIADGDISKLTKAIETDDAYWEEAAEERGLTVEQYRAVQKLERENEELRAMQRRAQGEQRMNSQLAEWQRQGDALKQIYPDFNLRREAQNRDFLALLNAGIPVQKAYETMHLDELITGAASVAAQAAEQRTVSQIRNRASRPAENGTSSKSTATVKSNVSSLTKEDREEIARRVARGETIRF